MKDKELVIIGGGPGGIAVAIEATKSGVAVTLLDENPRLGGQIYRQFDEGFKVSDPRILDRDYDRGIKLLGEFNAVRSQVDYLNDTLVWGIFEQKELAYLHGEISKSLRYKQLIVANGAYDRPVSFPGWTLPGVFTAGGAQRLVKMQRVLPGDRILLAGTGPLQLVLAVQIIEAGGHIEAILEAGDVGSWIHFFRGI